VSYNYIIRFVDIDQAPVVSANREGKTKSALPVRAATRHAGQNTAAPSRDYEIRLTLQEVLRRPTRRPDRETPNLDESIRLIPGNLA
jgi:hypothetical protein